MIHGLKKAKDGAGKTTIAVHRAAFPARKKRKLTSKTQSKKEERHMSKTALKRRIAGQSPPASIFTEPAPVPLTVCNLRVRIDSRITAALLRAMTERRIHAIAPSTQQDIVAEAMVAWLKKNGYFQ